MQSQAWPKEITLQGAGMSEMDGRFIKCEDFCGVAQWKHTNRDFFIFWGGDFEGYWIIGHSHRSGDGYRYSQAPATWDNASAKGQGHFDKDSMQPGPPTADGWGVYITGYDPPKFVGGVEPAPKVQLHY
jgi:hypothetical protein